MSMQEDAQGLLGQRYDLMMRRERWRGIGDGAGLCNSAIVFVNLVLLALGQPAMSLWLYACAPAVSIFALWRHERARKDIAAADERFRAVTSPSAPKAVEQQKALN